MSQYIYGGYSNETPVGVSLPGLELGHSGFWEISYRRRKVQLFPASWNWIQRRAFFKSEGSRWRNHGLSGEDIRIERL